MRPQRSFLAVLLFGALGCSASFEARMATVVTAIREADDRDFRVRPALEAEKLAAMTETPQGYFRGAGPVWARDWRAGIAKNPFPRCGAITVPSLGDPHVENFGTLEAADGTLRLEANDVDAADRAAPGWDILRLATSLAFAARESAPDGEAPATTEALARASVAALYTGYREALDGGEIAAVVPRSAVAGEGEVVGGTGAPWIDALFARAAKAKAAREELELYLETPVRFRRGPLPDDATEKNVELPPGARTAITEALAGAAWLSRPEAGPIPTVVDAVRLFGKGVASRARVRLLVLLDGGADGRRIVEFKEIGDANLPFWVPPEERATDVGSRIRTAVSRAWSRPDATRYFATTHLYGFPMIVRTAAESERGLRISKLTGAARSPEGFSAAARVLGQLVARSHRSTGNRLPCATLDAAALADEALFLAALSHDDAARFRDATTQLGPTLGVPAEPPSANERARGDLALLLQGP